MECLLHNYSSCHFRILQHLINKNFATFILLFLLSHVVTFLHILISLQPQKCMLVNIHNNKNEKANNAVSIILVYCACSEISSTTTEFYKTTWSIPVIVPDRSTSITCPIRCPHTFLCMHLKSFHQFNSTHYFFRLLVESFLQSG